MKGMIIGAGIGGLCTAIALKKHGVFADIFEAAKAIKPIGAGIMVPPNAMAVLDELGLATTVEQQGLAIDSIVLMSHQGKAISRTSARYTQGQKHYQTIAIHRGKLQQILLAALDPDAVKTGYECKHVKNTEQGVDVTFGNGSTQHGDFLIGADGLNSKVRNTLFPNHSLRYSGQMCWRGVARFSLPEAFGAQLTELWGNGTTFGFVPISPQAVYWYATQHQKLPNNNDSTGKAGLLALFGQYLAPVSEIIENTAEDSFVIGNIYDLSPMPQWFKQSVVLVGDAAHATTPNLGQGGAQAIEDAYALAVAMSEHHALPTAFEQFLNKRQSKANSVVKQSWQLRRAANVSNVWLCMLRNSVFRSLVARVVGSRQLQTLYKWP